MDNWTKKGLVGGILAGFVRPFRGSIQPVGERAPPFNEGPLAPCPLGWPGAPRLEEFFCDRQSSAGLRIVPTSAFSDQLLNEPLSRVSLRRGMQGRVQGRRERVRCRG